MSSSSSSASSSPVPTNHKRKRDLEDTVDPDSDTSDSDSDSNSEDELKPDKPNTPTDEDAPVLSHAARRKQKKEEKKQQQRENDSAVPKKKRKLKDGTVATSSKDAANGKSAKRQNSIWVGNMSFKTTEENLRTFFKDRGVGGITRVNMPTKAAKGPGLKAENRG